MDLINQVFGNKLRTRVSGILISEDSILMVKHHFHGDSPFFWGPPGGGMEFGECAEQTLKREFLEETGLVIEPIKFLFVHEFLRPPLHAIELFFEVKIVAGKLKTGFDPELTTEDQIIENVEFLTFDAIEKMDKKSIHQFLTIAKNKKEILSLKGYLKI